MESNQNDNHIANDDCDVWEDSGNGDDALAIANRDWNRQIDSIQNASFHEGFDGEIGEASQRGFDEAWKLIFTPALVFGELNAILSIISKTRPDEAKTQIERLRKFMETLMAELKENPEAKDMPERLKEEYEQIQKDISSIEYQ